MSSVHAEGFAMKRLPTNTNTRLENNSSAPKVLNSPFSKSVHKTSKVTTSATGNERDAACLPPKIIREPSLEPYVGKLERFELFQTNQCYYLIGCNKLNTAYRVLKMDRTLIERPVQPTANPVSQRSAPQMPPAAEGAATAAPGMEQQQTADASHKPKPTLRPISEFLTEDPLVYSQEEIKEMLDMIHDGNRLLGTNRSAVDGSNTAGEGLKPIVRAYGIVGFVRFLDCYYLTLITRRAKVGSIGGNGIYTIKNTESFPLKPAERGLSSSADHDQNADPSSVLLSMWNRGKRSVGLGLTNREIAELRYQGLYQVVDLTKNFYFSYTYDLTRGLQENFLSTTSQPYPPPPFKDMYAWNFFLTRELESCTNSLTSFHWVMPIIHGAFIQRKLNDYGRSLNLILVARRSRHFAGTRYLKRGVSEQGKVANDVEHEQILHDESKSASSGVFSSYLQVRGSIPTFWTQESSVTMPKPPIELNRVDPTYTATQLHFEDLLKRYGSPIVVLDLVKQSEKREREVRVGNEYRHAIDYINTSIDEAHKVRYCALDYSHISKHRHLDVSTSLNEVATWSVNQTGFFCSAPKWKILEGGIIEPFDEEDAVGASVLTEHLGVPVFPMEQRGVLRTNCIDCLDRTNVAQFSAGVEAIEQQLVVMGIRSSAKLDSSSNIVRILIDMYVDIGDCVALQYGGSEAHKKVNTGMSESNIAGPMGKHKELLTSIRRYYSNAFTDRLKQDAMNLFLGYYVPYRHTIPLWEMESDYYLHNFHVKTGKGMLHTMKAYQQAFGVTWNDADEHEKKESSLVPDNGNLSQRMRSHQRSTSAVSAYVLSKPRSESPRIVKVRNRCTAQKNSLSAWWKIAIQSNIQQRMWMQLGRSSAESLLPPRFERLYQPDKIAQFDRFFARGWATPVRRSHSAQHSQGPDDETGTREYRRTLHGNKSSSDKQKVEKSSHASQGTKDRQSLGEFISNHGNRPQFTPALKSLIQHHDITSTSKKWGRGHDVGPRQGSGPSYLGTMAQAREEPHDVYLKYVNQSNNVYSRQEYRPGALEEFQSCLHDYSLEADDVAGIRNLAESAHIGRAIRSGPYRGLSHDESAVEVATVIHEQFNALENIHARGDLREGISIIDHELKRRGLHNSGVKETVGKGWDRCKKAEKQYTEVLGEPPFGCRRSDLTTANSLQLYSSLFDTETSLSTSDLIFMMGRKPKTGGGSAATERPPVPAENHTRFVVKASSLGIPIVPHAQIMKAKSVPLFQHEQRRAVPVGFEQINDDLFARKDNKFMVFNGPGVESWKGTQPLTKKFLIDEELLGALK